MNGDDDTHGFEGISPLEAAQWRELFKRSRGPDVEEVPEGWVTITELSRILGFTERYVFQILAREPLRSRTERRVFRVTGPNGKTVRRTYVRLPKPESKP